jgi:hypothetical protein
VIFKLSPQLSYLLQDQEYMAAIPFPRSTLRRLITSAAAPLTRIVSARSYYMARAVTVELKAAPLLRNMEYTVRWTDPQVETVLRGGERHLDEVGVLQVAVAAEVVHHGHPVRRGRRRGLRRRPRWGLMVALPRRLDPDLVAAGARDGTSAAPARRPRLHPCPGWRSQPRSNGDQTAKS